MNSTNKTRQEFLLIALLLQLSLYFLQGVIVSSASDFGKLTTVYMVASLITVPFVFLLPLQFYCKFSGYRPFKNEFSDAEMQKNDRPKLPHAFIFIAAVAGVVTAVNLLGMLTDSVMALFGEVTASTLPQGALQFALTFIKTVIFAPILEETLFRGAIIHAFYDRSDRFKILLSASLFALMHYNLSALPYAFGAGVVISYFAVTKRSIKYGLALHFASNLTTFIFSVLASTIEPALYGIVSGVAFWLFLAIALVGCAQLIINVKRSSAEILTYETKSFPGEMVIYIIFAAFMCILNF